jgi:hypothetical protein
MAAWPKSKKVQCKKYMHCFYLRGFYVPQVSMNLLACSKVVKYKSISYAKALQKKLFLLQSFEVINEMPGFVFRYVFCHPSRRAGPLRHPERDRSVRGPRLPLLHESLREGRDDPQMVSQRSNCLPMDTTYTSTGI